MNLLLRTELANNYKSKSQIARVLTENWVKENSYCPDCGNTQLTEFQNNMPVADFYCSSCSEEFELKSKKAVKIGKTITDGAYSTMIERLNSNNNPHFFFLTYDNSNWSVNNFVVIPKHYFVSDIIIKRKPLPITAKRAGWIGCNINISKIPENGRIFIVKDTKVIDKNKVNSLWKGTAFLKSKKGESKGWILDIMNCVDTLDETFTLKQIYTFESHLRTKYPNNQFIKDKIRQQLQVLRDKGLIEFKGNGKYKKIRF
jgi:type II restriction enzyme